MTQTSTTTSVKNALMVAAQRKADAEQAANAALVAPRTRKAAPAQEPGYTQGTQGTTLDVAAQLAQMQAMMQQLMDTNAQLAAQNETLKKAAPAKKAEKPAPTPENMTISVKGSILTITVDLSQDTGKDTANGANRIVAQQNSAVGPYHITHAGKDHWLSCTVARPHDNAKELRAAYKAAKKAQ